MSKVIRVGFIGAGGIAAAHLKSLKKAEGVQIVGVYDIAAERAELLATEYGGRRFDDPYDLIDRQHIDALFVCTPPFAREKYETSAAEKGIHLFTEKPLGLTMAEVKVKAEIIRKSGIITSTGHSGRYALSTQRAKQFLQGRQVDMIHVRRYGGLPAQKWFWKMETCGGQMVDQTIHQVDLVRYLAGEFSEVYAVFERRSLDKMYEGADIYDVGAVTFRLNSGAVGSVTNTNLLTKGTYPDGKTTEIALIGQGFVVVINGQDLTLVEGTETTKLDRNEQTGESNMEAQDRCFIEAVRSNNQDKVLCSYEEGKRTLEVVLTMNESALARQPLQIDATK